MSDIRVKSTELHFFFVKIVTVLIFTFTISFSFNPEKLKCTDYSLPNKILIYPNTLVFFISH